LSPQPSNSGQKVVRYHFLLPVSSRTIISIIKYNIYH
jgi:hypothetical protein